tara:strand:+ start:188 stop:502 length:315 start_codon:yes stop_codon:yes gene_type:complete
MIGNLEPEEHVMDSRTFTQEDLWIAMSTLGWNVSQDDIAIEIGGTSVSGIDVGEEYNKKWQSPLGTRKYNKDAFIIIKNKSRTPFTPSVNDDPERKGHHCGDAS